MAMVILETAPDFPRTDLSETNAQLLELMLMSADIVERGHTSAEQISWVYRAGHPAMRKAAKRLLSSESQAEAFDHGVSSYETIAALVHSAPSYCDMFTVNTNAVALSSALSPDQLVDYIDTAHQNFVQQLPRAAEIVLDSSKRFYRTVARYAVVGAALARQFELDGVE